MKHNASQYQMALGSVESRAKTVIVSGKAHRQNASGKRKKSARAAHVRIANPRAVNLELLTDEVRAWLLGKLGVKG